MNAPGLDTLFEKWLAVSRIERFVHLKYSFFALYLQFTLGRWPGRSRLPDILENYYILFTTYVICYFRRNEEKLNTGNCCCFQTSRAQKNVIDIWIIVVTPPLPPPPLLFIRTWKRTINPKDIIHLPPSYKKNYSSCCCRPFYYL